MYHELGTPGLVDRLAPQGVIGVRNFQDNIFPNWEAISGKTLKRDFGTSMRACAACHVACGVHHSVGSGDFGGVQGDGPEFATTGMGFRLGIDNLAALLKTHELFNQYGLDIISGRGVIGWAMECYQRGILTKEDFGGTPLSWGDYNAVIEMIPKIAKREGFGNILAEGEKRAPQLVGRDSEKCMLHVKGLSLASEDPRADKLFSFQYLTATRGADHLTAAVYQMLHLMSDTDIGRKILKDPEAMNRSIPNKKGMVTKLCEDVAAVVGASGLCFRTGGSIQLIARALSSATGVKFSVEELLEIGERIFNVQKEFNARIGLTRKDDNFSTTRFTHEPIKDGFYKGQVIEVDLMLDDYYKAREWDPQTGLQTGKKLEELGLGHIADVLKKENAIRD
jgi:aldehyde:ferredoxin oxidoreductase